MDICRSNFNLVASDIVRGIFLFLLRALQGNLHQITETSVYTPLRVHAISVDWLGQIFIVFHKKIQIRYKVTDD